MILFPAIDLKDGQCVRLVHGLMDRATVFNDDPAAQARAFEDAGFGYIHLVDLNGAFEGRPVNADAVENILDAIKVPAQLGGGIRDLATIEMWLTKGIARVIIGTAAVKNPDLVIEACKKFPGRIAVGLDAKGGAWQRRAGQMSPTSPCSTWRAASRMQALPRSSTPTLIAMARCRGSTSRRR